MQPYQAQRPQQFYSQFPAAHHITGQFNRPNLSMVSTLPSQLYHYHHNNFEQQQYQYPPPYPYEYRHAHHPFYAYHNGNQQTLNLYERQRCDKNTNAFQDGIIGQLQRALSSHMNKPGQAIMHHQNINNEQTKPQISYQHTSAQNGFAPHLDSSKISMHQLLQKIQKQCPEPTNNKSIIQDTQQYPRKVPHTNPIYSKMSKYWQKSKHSRHSSLMMKRENTSQDNKPNQDKNSQEEKGIIMESQTSKNYEPDFKEDNTKVNAHIMQYLKIDDIVPMPANYIIKKIKTEDSQESIRDNGSQYGKTQQQECQQLERQVEQSQIYVMTNQSSSIHKNIRKRIINTTPNPQIKQASIGVQVNLPPYYASQSIPSSVRETIRNIIQYSTVRPFSASDENEMIKIKEELEQLKRIQILNRFELQKNTKQIQIKLGQSFTVSVEGFQKDESVKKTKIKAIFTPKQSNRSASDYMQSIRSISNQRLQQEKQEQSMQSQMMESSVIQARSSDIHYKKDTIHQKKQLLGSYPDEQVSIKFTQSNEEAIVANKDKINEEISSPTTRINASLNKSKYNRPEYPLLNGLQNPKLSTSKIVNVITSFSELRQIIQFQFRQFRKYINHSVQTIAQCYQKLIMEKEEAIFVLQIQKISLEDRLRDLQNSREKVQKSFKKIADPKIVIIEPGQFPKIPSLRAHDSLEEQHVDLRQAKAYENSNAWKQLTAIQQILYNQICNIQLDRYREFSHVFKGGQNN